MTLNALPETESEDAPMTPELHRVDIDEYTFAIVTKYEPVNALGEITLHRQVFDTREKADEHADRLRQILTDLGKWEQLVSSLRNLRGALDIGELSEPEPVSSADLKIVVVERKMHPFLLILDLADEANTAIARAERPWLQRSETWVVALGNVKRWRSLRDSLRALR